MKTSFSILYTTGLLLVTALSAQANVSVYISRPETQKAEPTQFSSTTGVVFQTETFNGPGGDVSFSDYLTGPSVNGGTYYAQPSPGASNWVLSANDYGGTYDNAGQPEAGGDERFLAIDQDRSITIEFDIAVNYFGIYWSAGSPGNTITLYNNANVSLGTYDTTALVGLLQKNINTTITATDGVTTYNTLDYYGQPNNPSYPYAPLDGDSQLFVYLHFINNGGDPANSIAKIVLNQGSGGGFESDNHTTSLVAPVVGPTNDQIILVASAVPEPSTYLLFGSAAAGLLWLKRRRARSVN